MDETVQMMKFMSEQITRLIEFQKQQQMNPTSGNTKSWDNVDKFRNIKLFAGEAKDWEEFATKFRSQRERTTPGLRTSWTWWITR